MKIGILSDIHGNYYALNTVLRHASKIGIEYFFVLGDLIGYYCHPELVVRHIRKLPCTIIKGNHERMLKKIINKEIDINTVRMKYGSGHELALKKLRSEELDWLIGLPDEEEEIIDGISFKLCHGSPLSPDEYVYPDCSQEKLNQYLASNHDCVFIGHSHYPFTYSCNGRLLVNVGSVGQSRDVGGLACWGVFNTDNSVYISHRTPYSISKLIEDIERYNYKNDYLKSILTRNRLDNV